MPHLDGVRACAFLMVASSNWIPGKYLFDIPLGTGVQLFFVLSGFLITGILLRNRPEASGAKTAHVLKAFYLRRILRIFPLYYLVVLVCMAFSVGPIRETWWWHLAYLSNFYYSFHAYGDALVEPFHHFWSLSVEEQFYLLWPLIVLTAPRRRLCVIICASIVGALFFRIGIGLYYGNPQATRYLTPSCMDALGVGSLIAYMQHYFGVEGLRRAKLFSATIGIGGLVLAVPSSAWAGSQLMHWIGHTFLIIFYGAIVAQAAEGFAGLLGRILGAGPIRYLGRISYGLYVYHLFAPLAWATLLARLGVESISWQSWPYNLVPYLVLTVVTAMISWHGYEIWFLRLKGRFDYRRDAGARATPLPSKMVIPPAG